MLEYILYRHKIPILIVTFGFTFLVSIALSEDEIILKSDDLAFCL